MNDIAFTQVDSDVQIALADSGIVLAIVRNIQVADIEEGVNFFFDDLEGANTGTGEPEPVEVNGLVSLTFIGEMIVG